ncbi:MAG: hypothetical protein AB7U92_05645 [Piscinibacter sp.]|uniref:hypothetical protein n=1 Tax=Piscinibacter sp. TaxID=1903157 RepID=UPI003D0D95A0
MPEHSEHLGLPSAGLSPPSAPARQRALDIAALGLGARDRAALVSMTRLLDGQAGLCLRWVEDATACTTLFVPHDWSQYVSPPRVLVRLTPRGATPAALPRGLAVASPLRVGEMTEALHAAAALYELARDAVQREHARVALHALRDLLVGALLAGERRRTMFGLGAGHGMVVDFRTGDIASSLQQAELLARPLQLADPQRATDALPWTGASHSFQLSTLLWRITHALIDQGVSPRTINGRYQLTRQPEPVALARPNMPRLVTAWTQRAMNVGEAAATGRLSAFEILWFLSTALALGIAVPAAGPQPVTAHA